MPSPSSGAHYDITIGRDTISLAAELAMERGDWTGLSALLS